MKELTKSEEQMMDIFWDSKEALTSVDIVKMQVKATWTNGLVHNIIRSLGQNGYLKECGMEQFGRQYARKLMKQGWQFPPIPDVDCMRGIQRKKSVG